jgi:hypothetical protein
MILVADDVESEAVEFAIVNLARFPEIVGSGGDVCMPGASLDFSLEMVDAFPVLQEKLRTIYGHHDCSKMRIWP